MQTDRQTHTQCEDSKPELRDTQGHQKLVEMYRTNPVATFIWTSSLHHWETIPVLKPPNLGQVSSKAPADKKKKDTPKSPQAPIKSLSAGDLSAVLVTAITSRAPMASRQGTSSCLGL